MQHKEKKEIRQAVRSSYGDIAKSEAASCGCDCGTGDNPTAKDVSVGLGYSREDVSSVPEGANMGLGCGNPQAIASLQPGETVVDLGSGGGFDCFLAARSVGEKGFVIGIDMTPEMIEKARDNADKSGLSNVEFRLGEIEHLPIADNSADVIISNCVINLSPEKDKVYQDAFRVLKNGGRLAITDVVATVQLPENAKKDMNLHTSCLSGASQIVDLKAMLETAGFINIRIKPLNTNKKIISQWTSDSKIEDFVFSATVEAVKP
ncbi:MAG: arsenite methyltransferase [Candidatus Aminicenantes bacterium]|nr:arsenite methyltransferase [Candidatus Aminicenantes bacterium]